MPALSHTPLSHTCSQPRLLSDSPLSATRVLSHARSQPRLLPATLISAMPALRPTPLSHIPFVCIPLSHTCPQPRPLPATLISAMPVLRHTPLSHIPLRHTHSQLHHSQPNWSHFCSSPPQFPIQFVIYTAVQDYIMEYEYNEEICSTHSSTANKSLSTSYSPVLKTALIKHTGCKVPKSYVCSWVFIIKSVLFVVICVL